MPLAHHHDGSRSANNLSLRARKSRLAAGEIAAGPNPRSRPEARGTHRHQTSEGLRKLDLVSRPVASDANDRATRARWQIMAAGRNADRGGQNRFVQFLKNRYSRFANVVFGSDFVHRYCNPQGFWMYSLLHDTWQFQAGGARKTARHGAPKSRVVRTVPHAQPDVAVHSDRASLRRDAANGDEHLIHISTRELKRRRGWAPPASHLQEKG